MKRIKQTDRLNIIALCVLMISLAPSFAAAAGKLVIEPLEFDCGVVDEGKPAVMQVAIQNVGDSAVLILNVQTN